MNGLWKPFYHKNRGFVDLCQLTYGGRVCRYKIGADVILMNSLRNAWVAYVKFQEKLTRSDTALRIVVFTKCLKSAWTVKYIIINGRTEHKSQTAVTIHKQENTISNHKWTKIKVASETAPSFYLIVYSAMTWCTQISTRFRACWRRQQMGRKWF